MIQLTTSVLNARVVGAVFRSEADAQDVQLMSTVTHKEASVWPILQQQFRLFNCQRTPVPSGLKREETRIISQIASLLNYAQSL